ncbi:MAG: PAS domain S-box protein [Ideonella sp.]
MVDVGPSPKDSLRFLASGGKTGELIAAFDWNATPLGPIAVWSQSLRTAVAIVLRSPAAMTLLWGEDGTMIYNDRYAAIAGSRHPACLGAPVRESWPEIAAFNHNVIRTVLAGGSLTYVDQELVLARDGRSESAWFTLDYFPVIDAGDEPAGVLALVVETTGKVRAEAWLKAEKERLQQMFVQSPGFMAMLDGPTHVFDMVNPAYMQLIGHRDVIGLTLRDALPELRGQGFDDLLDQVFQSGNAHVGQAVPVKLQRLPGGISEERYVDFVYQPVKSPAGEVRGIFVQGADVSNRVWAEQAVRVEEVRNRQILDSAIDYAIIAMDLDGKVTRWNEGAHRCLGWVEADMLGRDASCIFTLEDRAAGRMQAEMKAALSTGAGNDERWHIRKSGERFWANGEMTPILDQQGEACGFVKVLRDRTSEHAAQQALRESEARLQRAQEAGGVGTFTVDLTSNRLFATQEFCRIFGLDGCDGIDASVCEALIEPEDRDVGSRASTRTSQAAPLDVEYRIRRANDGALRWIERKATYDRDSTGHAATMVGVVLDVTERKAAQMALAQSAAQFRTFAQALPNHVWTAPPNGELDWFNDRVYEYSGAAPGALDGNAWVSLVHPEDVEAAAGQWVAALGSGRDYEVEFRLRRHDGEYRWHLARAIPLRDAAGSITRWVGTNTDINERKRAEVESTRGLERIWALSQELMLVCDLNGIVSAINPSATRLLGWTPGEMLARPIEDFIHPEDLTTTRDEMKRLAHGATTMSFENRYRTSDGKYRRLSWTAVPVGQHIHAVGRDVTRERLAEEALRQSQKMDAVGQLTGGVAHDFNNLLSVIQTSIELLKRVPPDDDRRPRFIESIANAVSRGVRLTGQLLAFARRQALEPIAFDAARNVRSISDMIGTLVGSRIVVELRAEDRPCVVHADSNQFDTAIVNMAVNARDAMDGAGRVIIKVARAAEIPAMRAHPAVQGAFVAVSLSDTGTGIEPGLVDRIFEPFFTTKPVGLGTGLGLSQVFGFAKQSGGEIQVESVPGSGTTFTLYLPQAVSEQAAVEQAAPRLSVEGRDACVLVVEDNVDVASAVEVTLDALGYRCVVTRNADEALHELAKDAQAFAVVFSDVVMAGMNGIDLAQEIRRRHPTLPVVLSSGYSDVLARESEHGFTLLPKPYSVDSLSQTLREAMAHGAMKLPQRARLLLPALQQMATSEASNADESRMFGSQSANMLDAADGLKKN